MATDRQLTDGARHAESGTGATAGASSGASTDARGWPGSATADDAAIEGLRGVAALMVVATHFAHLLTSRPGDWGFASTGVDLFFVLSGYVFAPYLWGKPLHWRAHLVRRAFRLYPLYLCALLAYGLLHQPAAQAWQHLGAHVLMAHTLFSKEIAAFYNPAFWSLPPEVEFYLLLPALAWVACRFGIGWLLAAAALLHLALVFGATPGDDRVTARAIATVHAPGLLVEFLLGSLAAAAVRAGLSRAQAAASLATGLAVLAAAAAVFAGHVVPAEAARVATHPWVGGNIGFAAAIGYALVVAAVAGHAGAWPGWARSACVAAGALSYGVYLFHNAAPRLVLLLWPQAHGAAAALASLAVTLAIAWALHRAVERPMRSFGRRLAQRWQAAPARSAP